MNKNFKDLQKEEDAGGKRFVSASKYHSKYLIFVEDSVVYCTANILVWRSYVLEGPSVSKPSTFFGLSAVTVNCGDNISICDTEAQLWDKSWAHAMHPTASIVLLYWETGEGRQFVKQLWIHFLGETQVVRAAHFHTGPCNLKRLWALWTIAVVFSFYPLITFSCAEDMRTAGENNIQLLVLSFNCYTSEYEGITCSYHSSIIWKLPSSLGM